MGCPAQASTRTQRLVHAFAHLDRQYVLAHVEHLLFAIRMQRVKLPH